MSVPGAAHARQVTDVDRLLLRALVLRFTVAGLTVAETPATESAPLDFLRRDLSAATPIAADLHTPP